jgi:tetratricopeptide (TPR) repeat protein
MPMPTNEQSASLLGKDKNSDTTPQDIDRRVVYTLAGSVIVGVIFAYFHEQAYWSTSLCWAGACLAFGVLAGFLFGIPKTLQRDGIGTRTRDNKNAGSRNEADKQFPSDSGDDFGQRVNTNLEDISDWLTKILVGLGLTQIKIIPDKLKGAAEYVAGGLGGQKEKEFALGLIIYFSVVGFLAGYLLTRLILQRAFFYADYGWRLIGRIEKVAERLEQHSKANQIVLTALGDLGTESDNPSAEVPLFQAHAKALEDIRSDLPKDRGLFITLGRVYRRLGQYDKAIEVLTQFIKNKEAAAEDRDEFTADAYYNRACYKSLKAASVQEEPLRTELVSSAIQDLKEALVRAPQLRGAAANDRDFTALHPTADFTMMTTTNLSTTVELASSQNPSVAGQSVIFTATVRASTPGIDVPIGMVTFRDGGTVMGMGKLNASGKATFSTSSLTAGNHSITVSYGANANFAGSTSAPLAQTVTADKGQGQSNRDQHTGDQAIGDEGKKDHGKEQGPDGENPPGKSNTG